MLTQENEIAALQQKLKHLETLNSQLQHGKIAADAEINDGRNWMPV